MTVLISLCLTRRQSVFLDEQHQYNVLQAGHQGSTRSTPLCEKDLSGTGVFVISTTMLIIHLPTLQNTLRDYLRKHLSHSHERVFHCWVFPTERCLKLSTTKNATPSVPKESRVQIPSKLSF